ncbi:uncharacterized protein CDAR_442921 [Caerostris darwini]|uniref:Uncharacterized protein n=1 Tax=Caerostris darwini TaxID=1538125 RepID=A0AAV4VMB2_9ARAC|nr:uncharacterized protein CDAR_442921 [Caerostris darwini]
MQVNIQDYTAPSGWVLQEENLIIVAGVAGGLVILMVLLVITAAVVAVKRRISAIDKPDMDERQNFEVRGGSGETGLCSSITPILPSNPLDPMMPLLSEMKQKVSPMHRPPIISPLLQHHAPKHPRRFLPNNCSGHETHQIPPFECSFKSAVTCAECETYVKWITATMLDDGNQRFLAKIRNEVPAQDLPHGVMELTNFWEPHFQLGVPGRVNLGRVFGSAGREVLRLDQGADTC